MQEDHAALLGCLVALRKEVQGQTVVLRVAVDLQQEANIAAATSQKASPSSAAAFAERFPKGEDETAFPRGKLCLGIFVVLVYLVFRWLLQCSNLNWKQLSPQFDAHYDFLAADRHKIPCPHLHAPKPERRRNMPEHARWLFNPGEKQAKWLFHSAPLPQLHYNSTQVWSRRAWEILWKRFLHCWCTTKARLSSCRALDIASTQVTAGCMANLAFSM